MLLDADPPNLVKLVAAAAGIKFADTLGVGMLVDVSVGATGVPVTFGLLMIEFGSPRLGDDPVAVVPIALVVPVTVGTVTPCPPFMEVKLGDCEYVALPVSAATGVAFARLYDAVVSRGTCEPVTGANETSKGVVSTTGDTDSTMPVSVGAVATGTFTLAAGVGAATGVVVSAGVGAATGVAGTVGVNAAIGPASAGS